MEWYELYGDGIEPSDNQIKEFVDNPLWDNLADYLKQSYKVQPKLFYSNCSMQNGYWKGWNVKYKKGGKALCSLYPKQGYFTALIAVGPKEAAEADRIIPLCNEYTQDKYGQTESGSAGKSLALEVTNEDILRDIKELIALRVKPGEKKQ